MYDDKYEKSPVVKYGWPDDDSPVFYAVCPKCGRFVKADEKTKKPEYLGNEPNATCKKCGRVQMPFAGWWEDFEGGGEDG